MSFILVSLLTSKSAYGSTTDLVWIQVGGTIYGEAVDDPSGESVAMSQDESHVAGATGNDGNGDNSGHVRVYDLVDGSW